MARISDLPPKMSGEKIIPKGMDEVMHNSMIPYAEHVILERALPRVEDGLKPVQRRILYTMLGLGVTPDKPHRKSARIVGDCLGKYHPHGDSSVYDAMVRMAQDFNLRMPLVDGHGNFGSIDGDSAAAMRYTETRMAPLATELLRDIEKDTVSFSLNFDDTQKEPDLLPGRFPNLLVNGSSGIAVGLATNIPPHNFGEAIDAVIAQMNDPDITLEGIMKIIPCPDFPTGGFILDSSEIKTAYETGRGKLTVRAKTSIETLKNGKKLIVIHEMPYQVNKAKALEDILNISQEKKTLFAGITEIRDESDRTGMRAVIEVKKDADAEKILQYLFKYSELQTTFGVNIVAIADGKPQQMGLKQLITHYIAHQENVVTKRTQYDLDAAERREHILEGLSIAILNIDEVIALIRASKTPKEAREALQKRFSLSEIQAQAILDLRLQRLTNLELVAIQKEYKEVKQRIKELKAILASSNKLRNVIITELLEIKEKYNNKRRTLLIKAEKEIVIQQSELKTPEKAYVALIDGGRIRRLQDKGIPQTITLPEGERLITLLSTSTDKRIKLFTNTGFCITLSVEDIPETKLTAKPINLNSIVTLEKNETIVNIMEEILSGNLFFYTKNGYIKLTDAAEYVSRTKRIQATVLKEGDTLLGVMPQKASSTLLISKKGMSIRFQTDTIPSMSRVSAGVKCFKLDDGDEVVFYDQIEELGEILVISDRGYAKRSFVFDYEIQNRNGKGLKTFDFKKNGSNGTGIAAVFHVTEPFDFTVEQFHGTSTILNTEVVRIEDRAGKGMLLVIALLDDIVIAAHKL